MNEYKRNIVTTANGKYVVVDTRYVPWPLGHGYETGVFRCSKNGIANYKKELDGKRYGESKELAETGHQKMTNKWSKEVLI